MAIAALFLFVIDFVLHLSWPKFKVLTKCLLMPLLILFYIFQTELIDPLVLIALACGCIGDFLLSREDNIRFFQSGLVAFLAGHLTYAVIFFRSTDKMNTVPTWFFSLIIVYLLFISAFYFYLRKNLAHFEIQFLAYCLGICTMSFFALARVFSLPFASFILPFAGSVLFIISDMILAYRHFCRPIRHDEQLIMATYALAQTLIVVGLVF